MKTQIGLYMDTRTSETLKEKAASVGVPMGDLADLCLRFAFDRLPEDTIRKWAGTRRSVRGPLAGGLSKKETKVLEVFKYLKATGEGAWRFEVKEIAAQSGMRAAEAFWALTALRTRKLVFGFDDPAAGVDRWDRPIKSYWCLETDRAASLAGRPVISASSAL